MPGVFTMFVLMFSGRQVWSIKVWETFNCKSFEQLSGQHRIFEIAERLYNTANTQQLSAIYTVHWLAFQPSIIVYPKHQSTTRYGTGSMLGFSFEVVKKGWKPQLMTVHEGGGTVGTIMVRQTAVLTFFCIRTNEPVHPFSTFAHKSMQHTRESSLLRFRKRLDVPRSTWFSSSNPPVQMSQRLGGEG